MPCAFRCNVTPIAKVARAAYHAMLRLVKFVEPSTSVTEGHLSDQVVR